MRKDWLALALVVAIWGFYYLAIERLLLSGWDQGLLNACRFSLAGILLCVLALVKGERREIARLQKSFPKQIFCVALFGTLSIAFLTEGQKTISSGVAGVVASAVLPFTALLGAIAYFGDKKLGGKGVAGLLLGFLGVLFIYAPWSKESLDAAGIIFLLLGALALALEAQLFVRWFPAAKALPITALIVCWNSLLFLAYTIIASDWSSGNWMLLFVVAFFSNGLAYLAYLWLIGKRGATFANLYNYLIPVVAIVAGVLLNAEKLTLLIIIGSSLCLTGALLVGRREEQTADR